LFDSKELNHEKIPSNILLVEKTKNIVNPFKTNTTTLSTTKILGFADYKYRDYALRWYRRLNDLGYKEQVIVAVDEAAATSSVTTDPKFEGKNFPTNPVQLGRRTPESIGDKFLEGDGSMSMISHQMDTLY